MASCTCLSDVEQTTANPTSPQYTRISVRVFLCLKQIKAHPCINLPCAPKSSASAQRAGSDAAFRTPHIVSGSNQVQNWNTITYDQFRRDIDMAATYWSSILRHEGIPNHSVIGLWLWGFSYIDILHIYGISRAGFVPQLFSLRLPNAVVIYELLRKAQTRALIYDNNLKGVLNDCPIPCHPAVLREDMCLENLEFPVLETSLDDTAFIFHTSGSTSGSPKLVPCSHRWIESAIAKSRQICKPKSSNRQDVIVWMGSMCHIAQSFMLFGSINFGSCIVQPTTLSFAADELVSMIQHCGVNRLNQFASYLQSHFRTARTDPKLLSMLKNLDEVMYSGLALSPEDENWARRNAIKLRNLFGSTECAAILSSDPLSERNNHLLSPLDGFIYRFVPVQQAHSSHRSTAQLLELVIAAESLDCPDKSLRHHDGDFHTGDLFSETAPGLYTFRGRDDDWIKTAIGLRCDTKAIEDNIRTTCPDLVSGCVVVGAGRPSPVMFIERADKEMDEIELKRAILRATRPFHSRRYTHERITSADMIVVVPPRTLPRTATKGNVRRKAVEEAYKPLLDELYTLLLQS